MVIRYDTPNTVTTDSITVLLTERARQSLAEFLKQCHFTSIAIMQGQIGQSIFFIILTRLVDTDVGSNQGILTKGGGSVQLTSFALTT
jgi:hypothetical protein